MRPVRSSTLSDINAFNLCDWLRENLRVSFAYRQSNAADDLCRALEDGVLLCNIVSKTTGLDVPGMQRGVMGRSIAARENISCAMKLAGQHGLEGKKAVTLDHITARNIDSVSECIRTLLQIGYNKGLTPQPAIMAPLMVDETEFEPPKFKAPTLSRIGSDKKNGPVPAFSQIRLSTIQSMADDDDESVGEATFRGSSGVSTRAPLSDRRQHVPSMSSVATPRSHSTMNSRRTLSMKIDTAVVVAQLEVDIAEVEQRLEDKDETRRKIEAEITEKQRLYELVEAEIERLLLEIKQLEIEIAGLSSQKETSQYERQVILTKFQVLEVQLVQMLTQKGLLDDELTALMRQLSGEEVEDTGKSDAEEAAIRKQIAAMDAENWRLQQQLAIEVEKGGQSVSEDSIQQLEMLIQVTLLRSSNVEGDLLRLHGERGGAGLTDLTRQCTDLHAELLKLTAEISALENSPVSDLDTAAKQLRQLEYTIIAYEHQQMNMEVEQQGLEAEVVELQHKANARKRVFAKQVEQFREEIDQLSLFIEDNMTVSEVREEIERWKRDALRQCHETDYIPHSRSLLLEYIRTRVNAMIDIGNETRGHEEIL